MSRTLGQVQFQLLKTPHGAGCDRDLLRERINDRYEAVLHAHPWTRLRIDSYLTSPGAYATGTLAVVNGSTAITLTGGTFTQAMQDRLLRISGRSESYRFSFVDSDSGALDVPYEGDDDTEATFEMLQNIYELPTDVGKLDSIKAPAMDAALVEISAAELDMLDADRLISGTPTRYVPISDSSGFIAQVELWPVPDTAESYPLRGTRRIARLAASKEEFLGWVDVEAIIAGCEADLMLDKGNAPGSDRKEAKFERLLLQMKNEDNRRRPAARLQMADRYTAHRVERAMGRRTRRTFIRQD